MSRSIKKGPYVAYHLLKKIERANASNSKQPIETWARNSMITPDFVNHTFAVHNGRKHIPVYVTDMMVGHRLGEFSPTRLFRGHTNKKKNKK